MPPGVSALLERLKRLLATAGRGNAGGSDRSQPVFPVYLPHMPDASCYLLPKAKGSSPGASRPVPPKETWISEKYGKTADEYLASGQARHAGHAGHSQPRRRVARKPGPHPRVRLWGWADDPLAGAPGRRPRDLGHGYRRRPDRLVQAESRPAFHFITTTTVPHLPFEDRHFGFIFAGSVFTHIDDLADTWIAELRRILRPGGKLFMTVHLENDIALLEREVSGLSIGEILNGHPGVRPVHPF